MIDDYQFVDFAGPGDEFITAALLNGLVFLWDRESGVSSQFSFPVLQSISSFLVIRIRDRELTFILKYRFVCYFSIFCTVSILGTLIATTYMWHGIVTRELPYLRQVVATGFGYTALLSHLKILRKGIASPIYLAIIIT